MIRLDGDARQVDRGEAQIAAAVDDLTGLVVVVGDDAGAAAHVCRLGLRMSRLVVRDVERCVDEREVREQTLGRDADRQLEQVVVRVARVVVDALLDLEDVDREDRGLAVAQTRLGGEQQALHDQSALRRGVRAVVERRERNLCAGAGVHGVQVVNQRLHRLIGRTLGLAARKLEGEVHDAVGSLLVRALEQARADQLADTVVVRHIRLFLADSQQGLCRLLTVLLQTVRLKRLGEVVAVAVPVGLADARRHAVIEVRDTLTAVLVVLVGLNRNAGERRIACDVVRLAQEAVSGGESALKQLEQVNLRAGGGQGVEVKVVDVDIALAVRLGDARLEQEHLVELLGALGTVLEHGSHRGVAVDVGVLTLDVVLNRGLEGQILVDLHQSGVHLALTGALVAVEDVRLRRLGMAALHQNLLHRVLYVLNARGSRAAVFLDIVRYLQREAHGKLVIMAAGCFSSLIDSICDFR